VWKFMERGKPVHELFWRPEVNRLLGRYRWRCEDVNKVDFQDIPWGCLDWFDLARGTNTWRPFLYVVMSFTFQKRHGNVSTRYEIIRF
jgi:hypothetical protein